MVQRRKAGKPDRGTIILNATQEGRNILIKIIDDGQGLDRNKIYHKALKMGLNPCAPDDDGIFQYIFAPGLSTKTEVSDVSGRGVGMDVVNSSIKMLGGDISINSEAGKGTEITLAIPMAIGISTALTISAGRNEYAIPFDYVLETIKVQPEMLHFANGRQVFHYRGKVVAVEHLADLLGSAGGGRIEIPGGGPETPAEVIPLVMLKTTRGMLGVIVDKLGRNLEIAIKPVPSQLAFIQVVSGVSIMGDGKVLMVLNPEKLFIHTALSEKCAVAA
jgi:two-component system chemotaxis sensor kinase CheA